MVWNTETSAEESVSAEERHESLATNAEGKFSISNFYHFSVFYEEGGNYGR